MVNRSDKSWLRKYKVLSLNDRKYDSAQVETEVKIGFKPIDAK